MYPTAQGGTGYNRTQTAAGLAAYSSGSVEMDCGTSASGARPDVGEYTGVTCQNNHVYGLNSYLYPAAGTNYPTGYGEVMTGNICDNGCNGSSLSTYEPVITGRHGAPEHDINDTSTTTTRDPRMFNGTALHDVVSPAPAASGRRTYFHWIRLFRRPRTD